MTRDKILSKQIFKKWWFWVVVVIILGVIGLLTQDTATNNIATDTPSNSANNQVVTYTITGETLGEYGKEITLNKDSDMPTKKYLYKLPAGTYKAATSFDKMASFYIVKDETVTEASNTAYPEELNYVGEAYLLTAGDGDFNGKAKKEATITLGNDESIQIVGTNTFTFEKQ